MVHTAAAFAKMHNRLRTLACTTSIGPGATNMITGAAGATINRAAGAAAARRHLRRPARRRRCCSSSSRASRRTSRSTTASSRCRATGIASIAPSRSPPSLPEAMRVLTSPAETGAVTLALPQDVQAGGVRSIPAALFEPRVWTIAAAARRCAIAAERRGADSRQPAAVDRRRRRRASTARRPSALRRFVDAHRHRRRRDAGGQGRAARSDIRCRSAASAPPARAAANRLARDADLVIVVGSRLSDFTTASKTAFQHERRALHRDQRRRARRRASTRALPLVGDARAVLEELLPLVAGYRVGARPHEAITARSRMAPKVERVWTHPQVVSPQSNPASRRSQLSDSPQSVQSASRKRT